MVEYNHDRNPLAVKSKAFAARIVKMVGYLRRTKGRSNEPIFNQVLRSGTSIMANISESQFAQSRADFITKLHISLKESKETQNWLYLLFETKALTDKEYESINNDCDELIAMLVSSINTAKKNQQQVIKS